MRELTHDLPEEFDVFIRGRARGVLGAALKQVDVDVRSSADHRLQLLAREQAKLLYRQYRREATTE
eukprot:CAMPEP_0205922116 /NCGR_PEP_ID=MMETSP1325-20131115/13957_1 /ASSEMBLY_ACC=CAM_ASM_000708 /TAXON_ID=236786 /ORGANISM="Florenciella sp., Strain RCC1007" /LENGTH=65 /DNA_ID=CAMNT_0053290077 /DNA_START=1 /DNA_END=198 /DNA_ORIENTATION=+